MMQYLLICYMILYALSEITVIHFQRIDVRENSYWFPMVTPKLIGLQPLMFPPIFWGLGHGIRWLWHVMAQLVPTNLQIGHHLGMGQYL